MPKAASVVYIVSADATERPAAEMRAKNFMVKIVIGIRGGAIWKNYELSSNGYKGCRKGAVPEQTGPI